LVCGDRGKLDPGPFAEHGEGAKVVDVASEIGVEMQFWHKLKV
jgi:hypothetical protein